MHDGAQGLLRHGDRTPGGIEIPTLPVTDGKEEPWLYTNTHDLYLVAEYTRMSFSELMQVDCITFKMLLRDAYINRMGQTEEGREYLENCWLITQTEPDRAKLRKQFKENHA